MAVQKAVNFCSSPDNMQGNRCYMGFLFLYEIFTGSVKCRVAGGSAHTYAHLVLQLYDDKHSGGIMGSILHILSHNPTLCRELALRFKDTRQTKSCDFRTVPTAQEKAVPLHDLFTTIVKLFKEWDVANKLIWPMAREAFPKLSLPPTTLRVYPTERVDMTSSPSAATLPACLLMDHSPDCQISNFACSSRPVSLKPLNYAALFATPSEVNVLEREDAKDLAAFCGRPLSVLGLSDYLITEPMAVTSEQLPFSADDHPNAQSTIAKTTLQRMKDHTSMYSKILSKRNVERLRCVAELSTSGSDTKNARATLAKLQTALLQLRNQSVTYVKAAIPVITNAANHVELEPQSPGAVPENIGDLSRRHIYNLLLKSRSRTQLWFHYICCSLLSVDEIKEWSKLNPFVTQETYDVATQLLLRTLFHATRVGQVNRCLEDITGLSALLAAATKAAGASPTIPQNMMVELEQKADSLVRNLTASRAYVDNTTWQIDPRFLIFEFQANVLLRDRQVELVRKFVKAVRADQRDIVEQMIMVSF